jgi:hypothetical protein
MQCSAYKMNEGVIGKFYNTELNTIAEGNVRPLSDITKKVV